MGVFDWAGHALDWMKTRWSSDWSDVGNTFSDSWKHAFESGAAAKNALMGMATAPFTDDGDFWGSTRLLIDSTVGGASGVLGGTLGSVFQIPILHEASWLLDKAYRYGIARPMSTPFIMMANANREAYASGSWNQGTYVDMMTSWNSLKQAFNDSEYITPGQALVYGAGMSYHEAFDDDPLAWATSHDPKTLEGQATFNSPDADFWLKYTSGSLDLAANIGFDPSHGLSLATKMAKLRFVDKVADKRYVISGKVNKEVGGSRYNAVRVLALKTATPEEFGQLALPDSPQRGTVQVLLWSAARMGEDIYKDSYLAIRAGDPEAFGRLKDKAPQIAADWARLHSGGTVADYDFQRGQLSNGRGADALRAGQADAFINAMHSDEGIWGTMRGKGQRDKMPTVRITSKMRAGYHSFILNTVPIIVGRPFANLLPSQGWTGMIDANDNTAISLRQFRANLERSNTQGSKVLSEDEINQIVTAYGSAGNDAFRHFTAMRAEELVLTRMLKNFGLNKDQLPAVLRELNNWRAGVRRQSYQERIYISDQAARAGAMRAAIGQTEEAAQQRAVSRDYKQAVDNGQAVDAHVLMTDVDGRLNVVPMGSNLPGLRSQFGEMIEMKDYRALSASMRWWNLTHPVPKLLKVADEEQWPASFKSHQDWVAAGRPAAKEGEKLTEHVELPVPNWRKGIAQVAKARGVYEATISAADQALMLWKSSALLRPAQAPRNVASDTLLTIVEMGKLPVLATAAHGIPNMIRNFGGRLGLLWETTQDALAGRRINGTTRLKATADVEEDVPGNVDVADEKYLNPTLAFAHGKIPFDAYLNMLDRHFTAPPVEQTLKVFQEGKREAGLIDLSQSKTAQLMGRPMESGVASGRGKGLGARWGGKGGVKDLNLTPFRTIRPGAPLFAEHYWWKQLEEEKISPEAYKLNIAKIALQISGRDWFWKADRGFALIKELLTKHINRRNEPGYEDNPYAPGTIVVDPFTGARPKMLDPVSGEEANMAMSKLRDNFDIGSEAILNTRNVKGRLGKRAGTIDSVARGDARKQFTDWVAHNVDELLKPGTLLSMRLRDDGSIAVGFAKAKPHVIASGETIKPGSLTRLKNLRFEGIQDQGHTGIEIKSSNGKTTSIGGWAESPEGQQMQRRVSSVDNPSTGYMGVISDHRIEDLMEEDGPWSPLTSNMPEYKSNWERDVNAQLASDPVARLFLEGKDDATIISTVYDSAWGRKWLRDMGFRAVDGADHIKQIGGWVDTYMPHPSDPTVLSSEAAQQLRDAALQKRATYDMLTKVKPLDEMPEIHGPSVKWATGTGRAWKAIQGTVSTLQKILSDMPVDKLARFPMMSMSYKRHGTDMVQVANHYFKDHDQVPAAVVNHIKEIARDRAYYDTRYTLYDTAQRNDIANATRLFMPFSAAMMDSYIKYGRQVRQNPALLIQGAYYWDAFERAGMIQDQDGNVAEEKDGVTRWYSVDPDTGARTEAVGPDVGRDKFIQFQLPSALAKIAGKHYYGVDAKPVISINKDTMNVFLNVPSAGPLVAFAANEFALSQPELADEYLIKKYVLPYGPSASRGRLLWPSTVRSAWDSFVTEDKDAASAHAASIFQAEMIAYSLHTRNTPPSFEEAREKAGSMKALRFMSTFASPASFQLVSPYQPYIDAYRQLVKEDPKTAAENFMNRYGDEFYAVMMSVTRNNAGLTATVSSAQAYDKYKALITQYPEFGGLIVGSEGAGPFSKAVYEQQKDTPLSPGDPRTIRQMMSLQESAEEVSKKAVWTRYSDMMNMITAAMVDRGAKSLDSRNMADLKQMKEAFVEKNRYWKDPNNGTDTLSPWYLDYQSSDRGQIERKFEALRVIARDPNLSKRDDIRGLLQYLEMRDETQELMRSHAYATLDSNRATLLKRRWQGQVHALVESNIAFADLWNRWLSNDEHLDVGGVENA